MKCSYELPGFPPRGQHPSIWMVYHRHEHRNYLIINLEERSPILSVKISALHGKLEPGLGLGRFAFRIVQLVNKSCLITSFTPRLRQVSADRSRRTPNLISQ